MRGVSLQVCTKWSCLQNCLLPGANYTQSLRHGGSVSDVVVYCPFLSPSRVILFERRHQ